VRIDLPDPSLVVLIGPSGSGKSSFARTHFAATEVISSDFCRGLVADDENDQSATKDAFAVLQFIAGRRLAQPRFTVVDATNVQREARRPLIELAKQHDLFPVAIVLDIPEAICQERNRSLVEYLSISRILWNAPSKYGKSFLLTETDDRDLTYFIDYQLVVIKRAIEELHAYLTRKAREMRNIEQLMRRSQAFNHRQLALLSYALRKPKESFTFRSHAESHGVTHETARNDLAPLVEKGLLARRTVRGRHVFTPPPDLPDMLKWIS
jgi:predicted kinase